MLIVKANKKQDESLFSDVISFKKMIDEPKI